MRRQIIPYSPELKQRARELRRKMTLTEILLWKQLKGKQLWMGLVEVRALKGTRVLTDAKGAFLNLVTWASDGEEFKSKAELVLGKLGLFA